MTEEDYATILKTLTGNFAEGSELSSMSSPSVDCSIQRETNVTERRHESSEKAVSEIDESPLSTSTAKSLAFSFKLDEVTALLYRGSSNLVCNYIKFLCSFIVDFLRGGFDVIQSFLSIMEISSVIYWQVLFLFVFFSSKMTSDDVLN